MRTALIPLFALTFGAMACDASPGNRSAPANTAESAQSTVKAEPVTFKAADGVTVHGLFYQAPNPRALVLLFHQAGSSKAEYATIAPRLVRAGFSALAIDQRAGGEMFGPNETVAELGHSADFLDAKKDMEAAFAWAKDKGLPIILWGSSYSSSLIFPLAAEHPGEVAALLAFSPGEYFDDKQLVERAAAKVTAPVFVASVRSGDDAAKADQIFMATKNARFVTRSLPTHGVHGSSTLIPSRNPEGAEENWQAVLGFLDKVAPPRKQTD